MSFRQITVYPKYDTVINNGQSNQISIGHNVEKRIRLIAIKLPKWGPRGAVVGAIQEMLNNLVKINFNHRHVYYVLNWMVNRKVIGRRGTGVNTKYYAYVSTGKRLERALANYKGK